MERKEVLIHDETWMNLGNLCQVKEFSYERTSPMV